VATASRSQVPMTIDVGDRFAELGQISRSHAVIVMCIRCIKPCPHCRRKVRLAVVSPFSATVALFCDSVDTALEAMQQVIVG